MVINDLLNQIATHNRQLEQLLKDREGLIAQLEAAQALKNKDPAKGKEQEAKLAQLVRNKDGEIQDFVRRQEQFLSLARAQEEKLEALENRRRFLRFVVGAGVPLYRLPDLQLGQSGIEASPGGSGSHITELEPDVFGGIALLPLDLNSRDRHQTFSLGGLLGLGGNSFPANLYAGLTFKIWILYLNAGFNFRKAAGDNPLSLTPTFWQGNWTPTFFAGLSLDTEALLAIQQVLPSKSSPEGLKIDPK
jgi:hypothetical protein